MEIVDPVTGRWFDKQAWELEARIQGIVAAVRQHPIVGWPDETSLGVPDPDHSGTRGEIAFWVTEGWAYESYGFDPDDLSDDVSMSVGPGVETAALFVKGMGDGDLGLLLMSIPDEPDEPALPDRSEVRAAIGAVPLDPDSFERHQWRFDLRNAEIAKLGNSAYVSAEAEQESEFGPLTDFAREYSAAIEVEIEAGYCGKPDCGHCSDPFAA
jgi:hypothetical protein